MLFDGKHRPKGLEFAACKTCNEATRKDELVVSLLSRSYPDAANETQRKDVKKLLRHADRRNPGLLSEMWVSEQKAHHDRYSAYGVPDGAGYLRTNGPIVTKAIARFAAKLGMALHCEVTAKPLPVGGGVAVGWYSNLNAIMGDRMPNEMLAVLGRGLTLEQGSFRVPDQFRYASVATDDSIMSGHIAVFRESFAIQMIANAKGNEGAPSAPDTFFEIGCFLNLK